MTDTSRASVEAMVHALEDGHPDGAHAYSDDAAALLRALLARAEAAEARVAELDAWRRFGAMIEMDDAALSHTLGGDAFDALAEALALAPTPAG